MNKAFYRPETNILNNYLKPGSLEILEKSWTQPHRFFHTPEHLNAILDRIGFLYETDQISNVDFESLVLAAYFHDVVYWPWATDNEEASVVVFRNLLNSTYLKRKVVKVAEEIILSTKKGSELKNELQEIFHEEDYGIFRQTLDKLIEYEDQIAKEYQYLTWKEYQKHRIEFLTKQVEISKDHDIYYLINYVKTKKPRIGIYAGSFRPFHVGHYNILKQAEMMFDKVIVAFGQNPEKEKQEIIVPETLKSRQIVKYEGFVSSMIKYHAEYADVTLIRGLRNGYDLHYEQNQIKFIKDQYPELKVVFLFDDEFAHVSSTALKGLEKVEVGSSKRYLIE